MTAVELRFHGSLHDLLGPAARHGPIRRVVDGSPAIKDLIESVGVPHVEVGRVAVDGRKVGLEHRVHDGERIAVYPVDPAAGDARIRFVADGHLGRLVAYLRMLGFDTAYPRDATDAELADIADREERVLLSRDRGLLKRSIVRRGCLLRSDRPHEQLREVVDRYGLAGRCDPFGRCLRCNDLLEPLDGSIARPLVPPRVRLEQETFRRCAGCGHIYWRGSHHQRMVGLISALVPECAPPGKASS
jgi:uncharacterized protein with PIN domain